jgi:N-methylhydantoinase A
MAGVVVPAYAGVFSALGLLLAPPRADLARSVLLWSGEGLDEAVTAVAAEARDALRQMGAEGGVAVATVVDLRYLGQAHETSVPYRPGEGWPALADRFHRAHEERNGFSRPDDPIEVVTVRAEATGVPALRWEDLPSIVPEGEPRLPDREVLTTEGAATASGWWRPALAPGSEIVGPAVIEEPDATTYLGSGERAVVLDGGALEVTW